MIEDSQWLVNKELDSASKSYRDELDAISDETINISHCLERLYDAIETGTIDLDELAPRIHELRNCQEKLQEINLTLAENRIQFIISR